MAPNQVQRTPAMLRALADFAEEIKGKPYCSLLDIVKTYGAGVFPIPYKAVASNSLYF